MDIERKPSQVEIIALDFYDGATEGVALSLDTLGASYFKLIAWDDNQNHRLFVAVPISELIFDKLLRLLYLCNAQPTSKVWLPGWIFENDKDETEANKLVESCLIDLKSKGIAILGSQVDSESVDIYAINNSLISSVNRAMQEPEELEDWLIKLTVGR